MPNSYEQSHIEVDEVINSSPKWQISFGILLIASILSLGSVLLFSIEIDLTFQYNLNNDGQIYYIKIPKDEKCFINSNAKVLSGNNISLKLDSICNKNSFDYAYIKPQFNLNSKLVKEHFVTIKSKSSIYKLLTN